MLATVIEGVPKDPFSLKCSGEAPLLFNGLHPFTLDMYLIMLSVKQGVIKEHASVFRLNLGLNLSLKSHRRTLYPLYQYIHTLHAKKKTHQRKQNFLDY